MALASPHFRHFNLISPCGFWVHFGCSTVEIKTKARLDLGFRVTTPRSDVPEELWLLLTAAG